MGTIEKVINRIGTWGAVLGAVDIGFCTIVIVAGVVARAFGHAIPGTFDLVETAIVLVGAFSFEYCELRNHHTRADVIVNRLSPRVRSFFETVTTFLSLSFWSLLLYAGWVMLLRMYREGEETELLKINVVPFRALWVFSLLLMCLILLIKWFHHLRDAFSKDRRELSA
jgi:TRAP-type C4-dicarboxylate transport system permease small subunit